MFMGIVILVVLPLFLVISARMVAQSDAGHKLIGTIGQVILYGVAALCVLGLISLIFQLVRTM